MRIYRTAKGATSITAVDGLSLTPLPLALQKGKRIDDTLTRHHPVAAPDYIRRSRTEPRLSHQTVLTQMGHYILAGDGNVIVERRATPRYDIELPARVTFTDGRAELDGTIINLSEAGARIMMPAGIETGDVLEIHCRTFSVTVQVIWWQSEGKHVRAGLKFVRVGADDAQEIALLLTGAAHRQPASGIA